MRHDDRGLPGWLELVPASAASGPAGIVVSGRACRTRRGLFTEWARALDFPAYFGHNWDAFADSLTDRAWPELADPGAEPAELEPLVITVEDAERLLAEEPPARLATLLEILDDVATGRNLGRPDLLASPPRLRLALRYRADHELDLLRRLHASWPPAPPPA